MEAIGLVASIITLISATNVTIATATRLWNLRRCPEYLWPSLNELNDFKIFLVQVQTTVEQVKDTLDEDIEYEIGRLIGRSRSEVEEFNRFLEQAFQQKEVLKLTRRTKFKEAVGLNQKRIDDLRSNLVSLKASLNSQLTLANARYMPRVLIAIQQVSICSSREDKTRPSQGQGTNEPAATIESLTSRDLAICSPQTLGSATSLQLYNKNGNLSSDNMQTHLVFDAMLSQHSCPRFCSCQCHVVKHGSTPRWLRSLAGALFFNLSGLPILDRHPCNRSECGKQVRSAISVHYTFPRWMLARALHFTLNWDQVAGRGATCGLRIPRVLHVDDIADEYIEILANRMSAQEIIQNLLAKRVMMTDLVRFPGLPPETFFEAALQHDREDVCLLLLTHGARLDDQEYNGVTHSQRLIGHGRAASIRDPKLRQLLQLSDEREVMNYSILHEVLLGIETADFESVLKQNHKILNHRDNVGAYPLHLAVREHNIGAMKMLLEAGANIHCMDKFGQTPLHWAIMADSWESCELLLKAGADVYHEDEARRNALVLACEVCDKTNVQHLLEAGCDPNHSSSGGRSCLMTAARYQGPSVCKLLLEYGADLEAVDSDGTSAVFYAIQLGVSAKNVQFFCEKGAALNRVTADGDTLLVEAAIWGTVEIMHVLRDQCIQGLPMGEEDVDEYWRHFEVTRNAFFEGRRAPIEDERMAFQALLDSVIPSKPRRLMGKVQETGGYISPFDDIDSCLGNVEDSIAASEDSGSDEEDFVDAQEHY